MFNLFLQREVGLVVLCLLSEVLPTLMDRQLEALPAGKAIADNVSHAAIAAASWMVILALRYRLFHTLACSASCSICTYTPIFEGDMT